MLRKNRKELPWGHFCPRASVPAAESGQSGFEMKFSNWVEGAGGRWGKEEERGSPVQFLT